MPLFGRLFDQQQYQASFLLAASCPLAGFVLWFGLTRRM
jgi:hypothetical protein